MVVAWRTFDSTLVSFPDLTDNPTLHLTNASSWTSAHNWVTVAPSEVTGNGYASQALTIASNGLNADGFGELVFNRASFSANGGPINYDRLVLTVGVSPVVALWADIGASVINDGQTKSFNLNVLRADNGIVVAGEPGRNAFSNLAASFVQPVEGSNVVATFQNTEWIGTGQSLFLETGGYYKAVVVGSDTQATLENLEGYNNAPAGTTINVGAKLSPAGAPGAAQSIGPSGVGINYSFESQTIVGPGAGKLRLNDANLYDVSQIYLSKSDASGLDVDLLIDLLTMGDQLVVQLNRLLPSKQAYYALTGVADFAAYKQLNVNRITAPSSGLSAGDLMFISFESIGGVGGGGGT
jgi:hypothetical protein